MTDEHARRTLHWIVLVQSPLVGLTGLVMFFDGFDHLAVNGFSIVWMVATLFGFVMMLVGLFGLQYVKNAGVNHDE